ncbi:helix-turn-helix domain-containing protein [Melghirimyces algeriensis]|uniref:DNA binding domain-containing protein, excisionase family n=1 Tax=Melghirimyces algeriensis TaxID=910412 RepID=A0A521C4W3_9BACL|nr:helix-turn-helix domain-containing protein [Melghirimyces algeriensis]SMO54433.1 DNA binding domain-containing protein, excisionase family [Melghirimyces algeriensis]
MTREDYPLILKAEHVAEILGISKRKAYEVMDYTDFPLVRVGRSKRVGRDAFFKWIERQSEMSSVG